MSNPSILHVATSEDWQQALATGVYTCQSLEKEGFIHACTPEQLQGVLQRHFGGIPVVWLLHLSIEDLEIAWESSSYGIFPHIYQPIPISRVQSCREWLVQDFFAGRTPPLP
jgi:uncharacterized protein (DUF952 family)